MKQATLTWTKGVKPEITLEHFTRPDNFILKLSGLLAFFICLLLEIVVSTNSYTSLHCWKKKNRCWLALISDAVSAIFQLQNPQQAPQPHRRATASSVKSVRAISPLQDCTIL